jgi:hypothetical protein
MIFSIIKLFSCFAFLNQVLSFSLSKNYSCNAISTGITRELKDTFIPNIISFSVIVEELSSVTFYSGEFIYAITFKFKNGLVRQYGDINWDRVNIFRTINLENKKILKYNYGFHNGKIDNLQLFLYDSLKNIYFWTSELGRNKKDELLSVDQSFDWSSYVEYVTFEGFIDGQSLRDWRMKYKLVICSQISTKKESIAIKEHTTSIKLTTKNKSDVFMCKQPFKIPIMKSKKTRASLISEKTYEFTAPSVYYCACSCSEGERSGIFFTCSSYEYNIKTRKCVLYTLGEPEASPVKFFLNDYNHITTFIYLEVTTNRTFTNSSKIGDSLGKFIL